jgi:DHA1 family bicyclomycin/chloramphenicol resistance-like MFS transporter
MGHIAGTASSLMGALATVGGAVGGALIGQLYDGTAVPVALCVGISLGLAAQIMRHMPREAVEG